MVSSLITLGLKRIHVMLVLKDGSFLIVEAMRICLFNDAMPSKRNVCLDIERMQRRTRLFSTVIDIHSDQPCNKESHVEHQNYKGNVTTYVKYYNITHTELSEKAIFPTKADNFTKINEIIDAIA